MRTLVVEDDPEFRAALKFAMRTLYPTARHRAVATSAEAVELFRRKVPIQLVIADVDTEASHHALRACCRSFRVPLVLISGHYLTPDSTLAGFPFLLKPFGLDQLTAAIECARELLM